MWHYKQDLDKTVQWNTHTLSGGVPVFGFNTKQKFAPQPMDNTLDQGGYDNVNPNVFRGKRTKTLNFKQYEQTKHQFSQSYNAPRNNDEWEDNIITDSVTAVPQAMYQGHAVNFSQVSDSQFRGLVTAVGQTNSMSVKSDTDIWNHINRYIWGKSGSQSSPKGNWSADPNAINPRINKNTNAIVALDTAVRRLISSGTGGGMTQQQVEQIVENYHGDDIALLYSNHAEQEGRITDGFNDRQRIDAKADATQAEHSDFHNKLQTLGDKMLEHVNSPHNQGGGGGGIMSYLPLVAVGGIAAYLLKGKLKL